MSRNTVRTPVVFNAATRRVEGGHAIYEDAFLFEIGSYPDKGFDLSEAEAAAAIADFTPVTGNFDHTPLLKGRAFTIHDMRRDPANPRRLRGKVSVPLGLDELLTEEEKGFSAEWDRATKRLVGGALTPNPRIKGASLVARFAAAAERHGADPDLLNETVATLAAFACACGHEAETPTTKERPAMTKREQALAKLDAMADDEREGVLDAILADAPDDDDADDTSEVETSDFSADEDPEKAELRARLETVERERREEKAANFAKGEVLANRIIPADEATVRDEMLTALQDDADLGNTVNFSQAGKVVRGTREQQVKARYATRQPHEWTEEKVASFAARGRALDNGGGGETEEQRKARLKADLQSTVSGRAALAAMNGTV